MLSISEAVHSKYMEQIKEDLLKGTSNWEAHITIKGMVIKSIIITVSSDCL